jgi:hypothetical protein
VNPEAVEWLESLSEGHRIKYFQPAYPYDGELFSLKEDHEKPAGGCWACQALVTG